MASKGQNGFRFSSRAWRAGALRDLGSGDVLKWRKEGCAEEASDDEEGDGTVSLARLALVSYLVLRPLRQLPIAPVLLHGTCLSMSLLSDCPALLCLSVCVCCWHCRAPC